MARKVAAPGSDSSLSPVADDMIAQVESKVTTKTITAGRKRKADATDAPATKRSRKTVAATTKVEDEPTGADKSAPLKRRVTKKVKVEEETVDDEDKIGETANSTPKVTKKKATTTRTKKQVDSTPLAARTEDTKLRMGAHVSTAGG
jgi:AP endonuclease-1